MSNSEKVIATALVVDDDPNVREGYQRVLGGAGFKVETAQDGISALSLLPLGIDILIVDGEMPHMDGFEVAQRVRAEPEHADLPIIMVTGLTQPGTQQRALDAGVNDFMEKPVDVAMFEYRCRWHARQKIARDELTERARDLESSLRDKNEALRVALTEMSEARRKTFEAHVDTIHRLTVVAEYRDSDTGGHIERIGLFSEELGRAVGMSPGQLERIRHAAPMHDVGKIAIPDSILLKKGPLDDAEWAIMRSHTTVGAQVLSGSPSPILQLGEIIALNHHERWDGSGYPAGKSGEEIPLEARICGIVDFYDALTMARPYRPAMSHAETIQMMREKAGIHFDPELLTAFMGVQEEVRRIGEAHRANSEHGRDAEGTLTSKIRRVDGAGSPQS